MSHAGGTTSENADLSSVREVKTFSAEFPRFPAPCQSGQGKPAPKVRPKGIADGNRVNNPELAVGDGWSGLCGLIGLITQRRLLQERAPALSRTVNRHWWDGRVYRGDGRTMVKELGNLPP